MKDNQENDNKLNIIVTEYKTYDLTNSDEAINFLIFALNDNKYYTFFIDFVFSHCNLHIYEFSNNFFVEKKSKSIFEIQKATEPFFNFFSENYKDDNVFYRYTYFSNESDLIKKQKINKIIDGLKKTLDFYFDFHCVSIYWNCEIDKEYDCIKEFSISNELCVSYTYYCICKILINYYDYLYDEFYSFIEPKNEFNYNYSNKIKEHLKKISATNSKNDYKKEKWFIIGKEFASGKIFDLLQKNYSARKIVIELFNNENLRNYITESFSEFPSNIDKAILKDPYKMSLIIKYFESKSLEIDSRFMKFYDELK